jgi:hypothetical protein
MLFVLCWWITLKQGDVLFASNSSRVGARVFQTADCYKKAEILHLPLTDIF